MCVVRRACSDESACVSAASGYNGLATCKNTSLSAFDEVELHTALTLHTSTRYLLGRGEDVLMYQVAEGEEDE